MNRSLWGGALIGALVGCSGAERGEEGAGASARWARDARAPVGGVALDNDALRPESAFVVLNEVVAESPEGDAVELLNRTDSPIDLSGYFVTDDPEGARQRAVLPAGTVVGARAFLVLPVGAATTGFGLGSAEAFALVSPDGDVVDQTDWAEGAAPAGRSWGRSPDGLGAFTTLARATLGTTNAASALPATPDAGPVADAAVSPPPPPAQNPLIINEVVAEGGATGDWIELHNPSDEDALLDGLYLTDDFAGAPNKAALPQGWTVPSRGWLVVPIEDATLGFKLSSDEEISLVDSEGRRIDGTDWAEGDAPPGAAWGRWPNHTGAFQTLRPPTPAAPNRNDRPTPLVINEVVAAGTPDDVVELYNGTFEDIDLLGYAVSDDPESDPMLSTLGDSLIVPARGFALLVVTDETVGFKLGSAEGFSLSDSAGTLVDSTRWAEGQSPPGGAWARDPDGTGAFRTVATSTLGAQNAP